MDYAFHLDELKGRPFLDAGYNHQHKGWVFPRPANAHAHFRDPENPDEIDLFNMVVLETARTYDWATAMPNLGKNRILRPEQAFAYRERICSRAALVNSTFDVEVPFYVEEEMDLALLARAFRDGVFRCGKMYPKNGTTGSDWGVDFRNIKKLLPLFKLMEEHGIILLVHGEHVFYQNGFLVPDRKREGLALKDIDWILSVCPRIHLVVEHLSSRLGVAAMKRWRALGYDVECTIAPQYLVWDSTVLTQGGMNPVCYSIPILKDRADMLALIQFLVEGGAMLGTDSAPHNVWRKVREKGCPGGVYNEPVGLHIYFHIFRKYGGKDWFDKFVDFACVKPCVCYGRPVATTHMVMREDPWKVPPAYSAEQGAKTLTSVIPMFADLMIPTFCHPLQ